ncbi:hypothetical protein A0J61_04273 [Choanephora cucurbitarum]|uniref:Uncharacterized protein n=1 Tax=Choanephora cucurbitarum TaxID=101091 RepID=A0A1C7NF54_9FUNG|nr:hypothetical protein A0J61_04273 [Choanephora cucurbitarum]
MNICCKIQSEKKSQPIPSKGNHVCLQEAMSAPASYIDQVPKSIPISIPSKIQSGSKQSSQSVPTNSMTTVCSTSLSFDTEESIPSENRVSFIVGSIVDKQPIPWPSFLTTPYDLKENGALHLKNESRSGTPISDEVFTMD